MTKADLLNAMSEKMGITKKEVEKFLLSLNETVHEGLNKNEKVILPGLGNVKLRYRKAKKCIVPKSERVVNVPAHNVPVFRVNKKFKHIFKK